MQPANQLCLPVSFTWDQLDGSFELQLTKIKRLKGRHVALSHCWGNSCEVTRSLQLKKHPAATTSPYSV